MLCLWNGEYEEHEISEFYASINGAEKNLDRMEREYAKYPGMVVGDFTCIKVEYDWGKRDQRWTVKCNRCGEVSYRYHAKEWVRGKGRSLSCQCRKSEKISKKEKERQERLLKEQKFLEYKKETIGKIYGDYEIIDINRAGTCEVKCTVCGKIKRKGAKINIENLIDGKVQPCDHRKPTDYSDSKWIGQRNGHLTAIGRDESLFICRCDCGNELSVRPVDLFTRKTKKCCGEPDCKYSSVIHRKYQENKKNGIAYEKIVEKQLIDKGYKAEVTKGVGDYGVDIIITNNDGTLTAVQCKKQIDPAGVEAIQEVYAGGRFYDCTKFAVICDQGFSNNAIIMARKLGVYLCNGDFNMPSDIDAYASELLPTFYSLEKNKKYYELNGEKKTLGEWCGIYNKPVKFIKSKIRDGVPLEIALNMEGPREKTIYSIGDLTGTLQEIGRYFNIYPQTLSYRMKIKGMSIEEAILASYDGKDQQKCLQ